MRGQCVFCSIVRGEAAASVVYRDEMVMAFMDIQPVNPGHTLVIPLEHHEDMATVGDEMAGRLSSVSRDIGTALAGSGMRFEGYNLWVANGEAAGQEVFHVHFHVLPRFAGDGFHFQFPPGYREPDKLPPRAVLDDQAAQIREAGGWDV